MKAAVWTGIDKIEIKEIPIPEIAEEEALIKVRKAGVCVTDYHIISGKLKIGKFPNIQGHEICGEVVDLNSKRKDVVIGQRCVIATSLGCGHCDYCRMGKAYLCAQSSEIGYYPHNGGYAEYVKVPVSAIVSIPNDVSDDAGSILESAVCPTESLMRTGVPLNSVVLVAGVGPAGLTYIMLAKIMGAGKVIALVRGRDNAKRALAYGADLAIDSCAVSDVVAAIKEATGGFGADLVVEATGAASVIESSFHWCKKGGTVIQYGIPSDNEIIRLPVKELVTGEITLCGAVGNTKAWYPLVEMIASGKLNLERLITHRFRLTEISEAFNLYRNKDKDLIKAIIEF